MAHENSYLEQLVADKTTLVRDISVLLEAVALLREAVWEAESDDGLQLWLANEDEQYDDTTVLGRAREFVGNTDKYNAIFILQKAIDREVK